MDPAQARAIFDSLAEGVCTVDRDGRLTYLNVAGESLLGWTERELLGREATGAMGLRPASAAAHPAELLEAIRSGQTLRVEDGTATHRDGSRVEVSYSASPLPGERGEISGAVVAFTDISERKRLLELVARTARTDELTGLANRQAWDQELLREVSRAARRDHSLAVVVLELDLFEAFTDEHGHQAGDMLIRETGAMWRLSLRTSDYIARHGGEKFGILLPDCPPPQSVVVLERLLAYLPSQQTCSAGIAHWDRSESAVALLARADEALSDAKSQGGDRAVTAG